MSVPRPLFRLLTALALLWGALSVVAALFVRSWLRERSSRGGPIPPTQAWMLLNPLRERMHPTAKMVQMFHVKQGDTVLELGPGPGYFTLEASRVAGDQGRVLCVDLQPGMIAHLRNRLEGHAASAARPLVGDATALPLADSSVDAAFLVTVLGEIPDRASALAELKRVLKPGGVLSIAESLTDPDYQFESAVRDLCAAYGFTVLERWPLLLGYALCLSAPDTP